MSGIARGRILVANLFQLRGFGMEASLRRLFSRIAVRMLSNRDGDLIRTIGGATTTCVASEIYGAPGGIRTPDPQARSITKG